MKRNAAVVIVIVVIITALVWAGITNRRRRNTEEARIRNMQITLVPDANKSADDDNGAPPDLRGKAAPGFKLTSLEGKQVSLADYKGKPVLINFWATWCAPCKLEMPWFEEFRKKYEAQGLTIIGITEDDAPKETVQNTVAKTGATYPIVHTDNKVDKAYGGIDYLPSSYFVDRNGTVVGQTSGLASKDEIEANIKKIVGGQ